MSYEDSDEDPYQYVSDTLICARDAVNEAQDSIDVGPVPHDVKLLRDNLSDAVEEMAAIVEDLDQQQRELGGVEKLAMGADNSYEQLNDAQTFLQDISAAMGDLDPSNSKTVGEITIDGTTYAVELTELVDRDE